MRSMAAGCLAESCSLSSASESTGAFPRVILAEGEYRAVARNDDRTYEREFRVIAGVDGEVEVLSR